MEFLLAGLCVALIAALVTTIVYAQRHILEMAATQERVLAEERADRQMLLQRIQAPAQASLDHSVSLVDPQPYYPPSDDEEVNEVLSGR